MDNLRCFRLTRRFGTLLCSLVFLALCGCGGTVDDIKDIFATEVHGAIGFKAGVEPVIVPNSTSCAGGRCFSSSEVANVLAQQCPDCKVVLTFKGTTETTKCGSIATTTSMLLYGVGSGPTAEGAQTAALAECKARELEAKVEPSTCSTKNFKCL